MKKYIEFYFIFFKTALKNYIYVFKSKSGIKFFIYIIQILNNIVIIKRKSGCICKKIIEHVYCDV